MAPPPREAANPALANWKDCRRKRSSISLSRLFALRGSRPAANQSGGYQRQKQLVMPGDGVTARLLPFTVTPGSRGTLHYILHRTVVLNKVEVRRSNRAKRQAEIAHHRHCFQEDF